MKKLFLNLTLVVLLANSSCGLQTETQKSGSDIRVQIPMYKNEKRSIQVVTLYGITDMATMSGRHALFYYAPKLEEAHVIGGRPHARFIKNPDGIFIPVDSLSAEMAAVYYHVQSLATLDQHLGLSLNSGPRRVALSTRILQANDIIHNTAFYEMKADALIFVDFTSQNLPLTINPGVIAHEHFHSLYSKLVMRPLMEQGRIKEKFSSTSEGDEKISEVEKFLVEFMLVKSLNEGLADFWGWVYAQDENFVAHSLPAHTQRSLKRTTPEKFLTKEDFSGQAGFLVRKIKDFSDDGIKKMQFDLGPSTYEQGSRYARFFRDIIKDKDGNDLSGDARDKFLKDLILFLKNLARDASVSSSLIDFLNPSSVLEKFKQMNPELVKTHCAKFAEVVLTECKP